MSMKQLKIILFLGCIAYSIMAFPQERQLYVKEKCIKAGNFKNGQCVKVDNHLLYVESFGLSIGRNVPNVIFLPGSGNTLNTWNRVVPQVAKFAHVVTYDREGYGPSQQYQKPRALTAPLIVNNLISLLQKIHVPPPYILVGHSHGGLFVQYFALKKPNMISGMVLVDSSAAQMVEKWFHFRENCPRNIRDKANQDPHYYELLGTQSTAEAVKNEMNVKGSYPFGNIPMAVLTADYHNNNHNNFTQEMEKDWRNFQVNLAQSSRKSYQIIAYNSGHFIQTYQPKLIIDAIYTINYANKSYLHYKA